MLEGIMAIERSHHQHAPDLMNWYWTKKIELLLDQIFYYQYGSSNTVAIYFVYTRQNALLRISLIWLGGSEANLFAGH
jgi:hypothetical protein